ncbi:conserved hypothetical protein [Ignisphaera aggregans DSM 17230]|uniref:Uncharacterized protein n=1 Tax=Ignisphaera aggregans (strain DSM 17230 / JCM 13409 / AQ1.S1) TaxID=583356 RepID=E0SR06_IGNAA|nr:conserved hypothetical protein [Ignisphaera aggregans DSM 17230]
MVEENLREVLSAITSPRKGVKPSFELYHVIKLFLLLDLKEPIGRNLLSKELGLGITSIRTLIKRLRQYRLIDVDIVGGCFLTEKGREIVSKIKKNINKIADVSTIIDNDLKICNYAFAALLTKFRLRAESIGIANIRDMAIRNGAKAALVIFIKNSKAYLPPDESINEERYKSLYRIKNFLDASEDDVIIVTFSDDRITAEKALYNTIVELIS